MGNTLSVFANGRPCAVVSSRDTRHLLRGFTLVELLVALVIVAILARIAIPAYSQYLLRGQLVNATNGLNAAAAQMEQYFQDNRTYAALTSVSPPCQTASMVGQFTISCTGSSASGLPTPGVTASSYVLVAVGSGTTAGFYYTLDNTGTKNSQAGAVWGSATCETGGSSGSAGWMLRPGQCS